MAVDFPSIQAPAQDFEFHVPDSSQSFELPIGPGPYIVKLNRIEPAPKGEFGDNIYWFWEIYNTFDAEGKDVRPASFNPDGSVWCYRETTSVKFGANPKSGVKAKARERAEALLKREMEDGEVLKASALMGKPAMVHLVWKPSADGTRQYLNVALIEPYRVGMLAPVQPKGDDAGADSVPPF